MTEKNLERDESYSQNAKKNKEKLPITQYILNCNSGPIVNSFLSGIAIILNNQTI